MSELDTPVVQDDSGESRLVVDEQGAIAELVYEVDERRLLLLHTGVPESFRGRGIGGRLVSAAVDKARSEGLTIVPWCPYARRWLQEHTEEAGGVTVDFDTPRP
jgi:predicted GNAT family acetyltransferase